MVKWASATLRKVPVTKPPWGTGNRVSMGQRYSKRNPTCANAPVVGKLRLVGVGRQLLDRGCVTP